jgi:pullulanase
VNAIDWNRVKSYRNLVDYYKGLISIRKAYSAFREPTTATIKNTYFETNGQAIAYTIPNITHGEWKMLAIMYNNSDEPSPITLKSHTTLPTSWVVIANGDKSGKSEIKRLDGNKITIPPMTALILVDSDSYDALSGKSKKVTLENYRGNLTNR